MAWIRYTGPVDRVSVPRWQIGYGHPDGLPGWPRLEPVEVSDEAADDLGGSEHPEWELCEPPPLVAEQGTGATSEEG